MRIPATVEYVQTSPGCITYNKMMMESAVNEASVIVAMENLTNRATGTSEPVDEGDDDTGAQNMLNQAGSDYVNLEIEGLLKSENFLADQQGTPEEVHDSVDNSPSYATLTAVSSVGDSFASTANTEQFRDNSGLHSTPWFATHHEENAIQALSQSVAFTSYSFQKNLFTEIGGGGGGGGGSGSGFGFASSFSAGDCIKPAVSDAAISYTDNPLYQLEHTSRRIWMPESFPSFEKNKSLRTSKSPEMNVMTAQLHNALQQQQHQLQQQQASSSMGRMSSNRCWRTPHRPRSQNDKSSAFTSACIGIRSICRLICLIHFLTPCIRRRLQKKRL